MTADTTQIVTRIQEEACDLKKKISVERKPGSLRFRSNAFGPAQGLRESKQTSNVENTSEIQFELKVPGDKKCN